MRRILLILFVLLNLGVHAQKITGAKKLPLQKAIKNLEYFFKYVANENSKVPITTLIMRSYGCGPADALLKLETVGSNLNSRNAVLKAFYDLTQGNSEYLFLNIKSMGLSAVDSKILTDFIITSYSEKKVQVEAEKNESNSDITLKNDQPFLQINQLIEFVKRDKLSFPDVKSYLSSLNAPPANVHSLMENLISATWSSEDYDYADIEYNSKTHTIEINVQEESLFKTLITELNQGGYKKINHRLNYAELSRVTYFNNLYSILCVKATGGTMGNTLYSITITRSKVVKK